MVTLNSYMGVTLGKYAQYQGDLYDRGKEITKVQPVCWFF